jgi:hypothetical protein
MKFGRLLGICEELPGDLVFSVGSCCIPVSYLKNGEKYIVRG